MHDCEELRGSPQGSAFASGLRRRSAICWASRSSWTDHPACFATAPCRSARPALLDEPSSRASARNERCQDTPIPGTRSEARRPPPPSRCSSGCGRLARSALSPRSSSWHSLLPSAVASAMTRVAGPPGVASRHRRSRHWARPETTIRPTCEQRRRLWGGLSGSRRRFEASARSARGSQSESLSTSGGLERITWETNGYSSSRAPWRKTKSCLSRRSTQGKARTLRRGRESCSCRGRPCDVGGEAASGVLVEDVGHAEVAVPAASAEV